MVQKLNFFWQPYIVVLNIIHTSILVYGGHNPKSLLYCTVLVSYISFIYIVYYGLYRLGYIYESSRVTVHSDLSPKKPGDPA